jgi:hypothetical protein
MPFFPGERLADVSELDNPRWADNAMPTFAEQTGLTPEQAVFSIVRQTLSSREPWDYLVARPRFSVTGATPIADPNRWWVFDEDVDETEGWIEQATFTPVGLIDYVQLGQRERLENGLTRADDDGEDPGGLFPEGDMPVHGGDRYDNTPPRDPNAPVTVSIDLDEHEAAEKEGTPSWEEHDTFAVLVNENGFAVVHQGGDGIVRYPDHTACVIKASRSASLFGDAGNREARAQAEKFLAKRPYTTAYERVLGGPDFDAPEAPEEVAPAPVPNASRPKPEKRVWNTVSMSSAEDDD